MSTTLAGPRRGRGLRRFVQRLVRNHVGFVGFLLCVLVLVFAAFAP